MNLGAVTKWQALGPASKPGTAPRSWSSARFLFARGGRFGPKHLPAVLSREFVPLSTGPGPLVWRNRPGALGQRGVVEKNSRFSGCTARDSAAELGASGDGGEARIFFFGLPFFWWAWVIIDFALEA